jgi:TRAP-type C4-dicarboxylate transport system substrate-binding protein
MRLVKKLLIGTVALSCSAGAVHSAEKWDMPMAYGDSNYHTINGKIFADAVRICTGGELDITVHGGGSLFKGGEIKRAVQTGQVQIGDCFRRTLMKIQYLDMTLYLLWQPRLPIQKN